MCAWTSGNRGGGLSVRLLAIERAERRSWVARRALGAGKRFVPRRCAELRQFSRVDGHGRAESQTAQDNGKATPATPGTPTDGGHEEPAFTPACR